MTRIRSAVPRWRLVLALFAALTLIQVVHAQNAQNASEPNLYPRRIAVFGSSVANGRGDELANASGPSGFLNIGGYTGMLRVLMAGRGWEVLNQSRGGDTTTSMMTRFSPAGTPNDPKVRYLTTVNPSYVVIGLAFGNEGLYEAKTKEEKDAVYEGYLKGIKAFVDRARQNNIIPIVALSYTRAVYTPTDYEYVRRANLVQSTWDVPTVNFLGATDDGMGRWSLGWDDKHPQNSGFREMLYTFVPTLFEALEKGKPTPTRPADAKGFARVAAGVAPLTFAPEDTMHPFAVSLMVRTQDNGTVAAISGSTLVAKTVTRPNEGKPFQATDLLTDKPFAAAMAVQNGKWVYKSAAGTVVDSGVAADARWHHIVLSHYTGRGETLLFVDGKLAGKAAERLEPSRFVIGGPGASAGAAPGPKQADYKDVFIFRSALNADEVAVLTQGKMFPASLEIYSPLTDAQFTSGATVENRAQSMTGLKVGSDRMTHVEDAGSTN